MNNLFDFGENGAIFLFVVIPWFPATQQWRFVRKSLNDKTPFELFELIYGKEAFKKLNIEPIPPPDVELTPSLPL